MPEVRQTPAPKSPERFDDGVYLHALEALQDDDGKPVGSRWKWWAVIAALVVLAIALPVGYRFATERSKEPPSLSLSVSPAGSDLLIAWAGGAQHSRSSKLKVRDDGHEEEFDLRPSYEIAGTLVYHPKSQHVHIVWAVDAGGRFYGKEADYQVRVQKPEVAPAPPAIVAPTRASKPAASRESRSELERMQVHNRRMEALVKALKAREQNQKAQ